MGVERNITVRVDENEWATFLSISKIKNKDKVQSKKVSATARLREFIEEQNEADISTGEFKRKTYKQWAKENPKIMGKK